MRRSLILALILGCALLVAVACSHDNTSLRSDGPLSPPVGGEKDITVTIVDDTYLEELWALAESAEYDEIVGTIDCATGGSFQGVPASWLPDYPDRIFGLEFPPNAWDPSLYGATLTFRILVPRTDTVMPCCEAPMFFSLEADGVEEMQFLLPVKLTFSDHPALYSWCTEVELFSYDYDPLLDIYYFTDTITLPPLHEGLEHDPSCGIARTAMISHFSKWGRKTSNSGAEGGSLPDNGLVPDHGLCPELDDGGTGPF